MKWSLSLRRWQSLTCLALFSFLAIYASGYYLTSIARHKTDAVHALGSHRHRITKPTGAIVPGVVEAGKKYTRTLVVASLQKENTTWVDELEHDDPNLKAAVYIVDNSTAPLTVTKNKGHEVMVYLTHIIDQYDTLTDISIFMHAHLVTWHNNDILDSNSANMVKRLRSEKIIRDGYMNLRCHSEPGCPDHIHPTTGGDDLGSIPEAAVIGKSWLELFPGTSLPKVLSQPCCAQFAVSADRIRRIPRETYIFYRDWLLETPLSDSLSGRVWEYIWQYIFAGAEELCPEDHVCYCEGYGVCFKGKSEFDYYYEMWSLGTDIQDQVNALKTENGTVVKGSEKKVQAMQAKISRLMAEMDKIKSRVLGN
ncbi:hypothetical protein McanMca71_002513 [Microsporum canis]|uniref:Uncharacterized protein n=1 Tax=Arthroderma otae (strain ATCC MYA-4605 / CBS 113480) TaxID=554155 RepID=C5FYB0_ARTOC|nr:conserved hypothetical protein [Microsporum canis CBS 113480]EEQ34508.1 conserved hypothetical protein [Microsporum canis CBS 113480]